MYVVKGIGIVLWSYNILGGGVLVIIWMLWVYIRIRVGVDMLVVLISGVLVDWYVWVLDISGWELWVLYGGVLLGLLGGCWCDGLELLSGDICKGWVDCDNVCGLIVEARAIVWIDVLYNKLVMCVENMEA